MDAYTTLQTQIASIANDVKHLNIAQVQAAPTSRYEFCGQGNPTCVNRDPCQKKREVTEAGDFNRDEGTTLILWDKGILDFLGAL